MSKIFNVPISGVDPGLFSNNLMRNCERLVRAGFFFSNQPKALLEQVSQLFIFNKIVIHFCPSISKMYRKKEINRRHPQ